MDEPRHPSSLVGRPHLVAGWCLHRDPVPLPVSVAPDLPADGTHERAAREFRRYLRELEGETIESERCPQFGAFEPTTESPRKETHPLQTPCVLSI